MKTATSPLSSDEVMRMHAYWRACNYLAAGMIYLRDNPLLEKPLAPEHIKHRLLGHWGASPGLAFTYIHMNRLINKYDLSAIFMAGPGHGAPGVLGPVYLEGRYSEVYPNKGENTEGMKEFFKEFSFPGGIGSHCTPETPGSTHDTRNRRGRGERGHLSARGDAGTGDWHADHETRGSGGED